MLLQLELTIGALPPCTLPAFAPRSGTRLKPKAGRPRNQPVWHGLGRPGTLAGANTESARNGRILDEHHQIMLPGYGGFQTSDEAT